MKITILGCGGSAGVPHIGGLDGDGDWGACDPAEPRNRRTRTSILVQDNGGALLVDTSPEMRSQLLACHVAAVDAILFTHAHADHITGLDDVRILNRIIDRPMRAAGTAHTLSEIARRFDYAFKPWTPPGFFRPVLEPVQVEPGDQIELAGIPLRLFDQDHYFLRTLGFRAGDFAYSTDVVGFPPESIELLQGLDTWLVGCFQRPPHKTHAHLDLVLEWVDRLRPRRTVLTHMGNDMDWDWLRRNLPETIVPAYDGMVLTSR
jgi:phosphoribosyl 1,2-cyclic phosphate phosphodiesterase